MTGIPARFVIFGGLCVAWAAAMLVTGHALVHAAGTAWFVNWSIQISVTIASWVRPFTLPDRYYQPWGRADDGQMPRLFGVWIFEGVVRRINPLPFDRRSFGTLGAAMQAAETTHAITFALGIILTIAFAASGSTITAGFLLFWNVIFNGYAIALQRHNRARIRHLARKQATRTISAPRSADPLRRDHRSAAASSSP